MVAVTFFFLCRELPELARHYIMRILFVDQGIYYFWSLVLVLCKVLLNCQLTISDCDR